MAFDRNHSADRLPKSKEQEIAGLRARIGALPSVDHAAQECERRAPLGVAAIDRVLGGGTQRGALHEIVPDTPRELAAATGFALALALRLTGDDGPLAFIGWDFARLEAGLLCGAGLAEFGLDPGRLLSVRAARVEDALWAFEECLACRAIGVTLAEMPANGAAGLLTASRRLSLAARKTGSVGLLLRSDASLPPSAAATRWQVSAAPSHDAAGIGFSCFAVSLNRNRTGATGNWIVEWDSHVRSFHVPATLSRGLAAIPSDRADPPRTAALRAAG